MDGYRRGHDADRGGDGWSERRLVAPYRKLVLLIWLLGIPLLVLSVPIGNGSGLVVMLVTHLFIAGFLRSDIKAMRRQGFDWGWTRHLWFGAAFALPFVAPAYYLYSERRIRDENERRREKYASEGGSAPERPESVDDEEATEQTAAVDS
ncbi:hypothetical protein [Haloprofundus salilacus]|uniref:hypothetical protein n=1 Tax=Haloprofundus salilacus TaxID=2876190 RepID=UPI001CCCFE23|nr:hypothetical protein [Haloprofundus salilacus]